MKGIGILLVIIGHQDGVPIEIKHLIYAFHMPLFFILAGYFYKPKNISNQIINDFKRLILPYLVVSLFFLIVPIARFIFRGDSVSIMYVCNSIIQGNVGPIWFLLALFWCKNIYNIISQKIAICWVNTICILAISVGGIIAFKYIAFNPCAIFQGCSAVIFFHVGSITHKMVDTHPPFLYIICVLLGISYFVGGMFFPMDMLECNYSCWPVNLLSGVGGTMLLYLLVSKAFPNSYFLTKLGVISLPILCFHTLERGTPVGFFWNFVGDLHWALQLGIRMSFIFTCVYFSMNIKILKLIFQIKV